MAASDSITSVLCRCLRFVINSHHSIRWLLSCLCEMAELVKKWQFKSNFNVPAVSMEIYWTLLPHLFHNSTCPPLSCLPKMILLQRGTDTALCELSGGSQVIQRVNSLLCLVYQFSGASHKSSEFSRWLLLLASEPPTTTYTTPSRSVTLIWVCVRKRKSALKPESMVYATLRNMCDPNHCERPAVHMRRDYLSDSVYFLKFDFFSIFEKSKR